jgi:Tfp pilus assembly protein PilF
MVSRVYTPLIPAYPRSQGIGNNRNAVSSDEPKQPNIQAEANDTNRPSAGLQAVQYDRFQKIPLDAVIHDFKSTMNALGADEQTRSEVAAYLNVVRLQAAKEQPEVPFIKQTLRTAANSLDQFIGKALGQPSKVVKEWVDALLLQDINYHAQLAPEETASSTPSNEDTPSQPEENQLAEDPSINNTQKSQLKSLIEEAKICQKQNNTTEAHQKLQQALELLDGQNRPDWEGKVWQLKGRCSDQDGQWETAISDFEQAATQFKTANLPLKQASALHAMASIWEDHGQLEKAQTYYQQVVALDTQYGDAKAQLRSLNDLGSIYLRRGNADQATQTLQQAIQLMQNNTVPMPIQSDLLSNLAAAQRKAQDFPNAIQTYQQSLKIAREAKDRSRYTTTLQQLASLFVEANQPDQAMKALQRLKSLG